MPARATFFMQIDEGIAGPAVLAGLVWIRTRWQASHDLSRVHFMLDIADGTTQLMWVVTLTATEETYAFAAGAWTLRP